MAHGCNPRWVARRERLLFIHSCRFLLRNIAVYGTIVLRVDEPNGDCSYDAGFGLCLSWHQNPELVFRSGVSGFRRRAKTNGLSPCQIGQGESNLLRCIALDVPLSGGPPTTVSARVIRPIVAAPVSRIRVSTCRKSELQAAWIYPLR